MVRQRTLKPINDMPMASFYFKVNLSGYNLEKHFIMQKTSCVLKFVFQEFNIFLEMILFNFKQ